MYKNETSKRIIFDKIKLLLKKNGYSYIDIPVLDESELFNSLSCHIYSVDAIFSSTDNLIASALPLIAEITKKNQKPFLVCLKNGAENGALVSVGMEYAANGYDCAEIAYQILNNKINPSDIPLKYGMYNEWFINQKTADAIHNIKIPQIINKAINII